MSQTSVPEQGKVARLMIFIDFWNYELSMKALDPTFLTNWFQIPNTIKQEVEGLFDIPVQYERYFIMGSYDPKSQTDIKLKEWATKKVLAKVPGVTVDFTPRQQRKKGPCCTGKDHHEIRECPVCGASMLGTQEKGVDTKIATGMMRMAYTNKCDVIVLLSADKDFIPAVEDVLNQGVKTINAYFPNRGIELANNCWASFDLFQAREKFRR